ncbi:DUF917 domain-containing protein [Aminicella lysinilytica]|uniref:DUF917 domain-containing protein n=1 Tax=Aminicella lysinilytica TaxID=433323 RepID=UPI0026EA1BBD|nr:DUF917 domain-containing protein [Aminicella lysinilytica]
MIKLSGDDIKKILYGCAVLGTGGGGNLEDGLEMMREDIEEKRDLYLADLSELPDDAYIATPYGCGAPKALNAKEDEKYSKLPHLNYPSSLLSFRSMEEYIGEKFFAVSSTELGGCNTAEALHTACQLGLPIMDSDPAGRSVPELQHSTYYVKNKSITPMTVATDFGEVVIVKDTVDDFRAEDIVRSIAVASDSMVGVTDHPMLGKDYKEAIIPNAISYAKGIGETLLEKSGANASGQEVADAIAKEHSGKVLFKGNVTSSPWEQRDGFNFGEINLNGKDDYAGETYKICFKNENIISYRNGEVDVVVPDLICMLNDKGMPITTPNFENGMEINVFALPAPEIWTTDEGLACFGPAHFGLPVEYKPFK